jgi:hypothetical protein
MTGPQHFGNQINGHEPRPLNRQQLEQLAGLSAAQVTIGKPDTAAEYRKGTR